MTAFPSIDGTQGNPGNRDVRVLIVDDSVVARTVLERIIAAAPGFTVVHKSGNAGHALEFLANGRADIILLDVEMPGQSGLAALPAIIRAGAGAKVIILSSNCEEGSAAAVEALALGASDILSKPTSGSFGDCFSSALIDRLGRLTNGDAGRKAASRATVSLRRHRPGQMLGCIGIGASTGGIHALGQLLGSPDVRMGVPILLTQHLPPSFIPFFANQLARMTSLPVSVAEHGEMLAADHIHIAPGEAHLCCSRSISGRVIARLSKERAPYGSFPAVDPMFSAMAETFGSGATGIVLTGMGRDGTIGARSIVANGGMIVAQDEASSVVWGMPGSVARAGLASALLKPEAIMAHIARHMMVVA